MVIRYLPNYKVVYRKVLETNGYDFLRNDPLLKDNILFLTIAGSHAYGTNDDTVCLLTLKNQK